MKRMIAVSIAFHLFFAMLLWLSHESHWRQTRIKPRLLNVQWITLPVQAVKSPAPPPPPEKRVESPKKASPKQAPPPKIKIHDRPVEEAKMPLPPPKTSPAVQKMPEPPPLAKVEPATVSEPAASPPAIEMAPVSQLDPDYADRVKKKVEYFWNPETFNGVNKEVAVSFILPKDGIIKRMPQVIKSSGDPNFDRAAIRAVMEARTFGPLPSDYPNSSLEITCSFRQNKGS